MQANTGGWGGEWQDYGYTIDPHCPTQDTSQVNTLWSKLKLWIANRITR